MTHRRHEGGGDPAQGPPPDTAERPPAPRDVDEFPDTPDDNRPGAAPGGETPRPPDQPDPDAFSARLGLGGEDSPGAGETGDTAADDRSVVHRALGGVVSTVRRVTPRVLDVAGRAAGAARERVTSTVHRIRSSS